MKILHNLGWTPLLQLIERILILEIISIRHMTRLKEWMTPLKFILTLTMNIMKMIIPQGWSSEKTLPVAMTDMN